MATMSTDLLEAVIEAGQDFEWYPTTGRMVEVVAKKIGKCSPSIMDIGAGDGRVLLQLGELCGAHGVCDLFAIEKSAVLAQAWPENITPVGTDFFEQNLACLKVDYIFCNPPYSQFEAWACAIIESGYANRASLVVPQRWKDSKAIAASLKKRKATARVIHSDDFNDAERRARAVVDIVEVKYPKDKWEREQSDPFDAWFDQNIDTFEKEEELADDKVEGRDMARLRELDSIVAMVEAFNEEYARMEENYRAIFKLDYAILKELGVNKEGVREGIKKRMAGLKTKYWQLLFNRLDTITSRLSTDTRRRFLEKLTGRTAIAFTASNAYTVVLWAIKHANKYYDEQLVQLFRDLSTFEGVLNYKSNLRTWKNDDWRYHRDDPKPSHYTLDYRIVVMKHSAIPVVDRHGYTSSFESPGGLHKNCHELIEDTIAVLHNLGFSMSGLASRVRYWQCGEWEDFFDAKSETLFQVKAHKNGNLHFRFKPEAIRALNVEAGRLLGWLRDKSDVVTELGYTAEEAAQYFGASRKILPSNVRLLAGPAPEAA